jgi:hypothetical protein
MQKNQTFALPNAALRDERALHDGTRSSLASTQSQLAGVTSELEVKTASHAALEETGAVRVFLTNILPLFWYFGIGILSFSTTKYSLRGWGGAGGDGDGDEDIDQGTSYIGMKMILMSMSLTWMISQALRKELGEECKRSANLRVQLSIASEKADNRQASTSPSLSSSWWSW